MAIVWPNTRTRARGFGTCAFERHRRSGLRHSRDARSGTCRECTGSVVPCAAPRLRSPLGHSLTRSGTVVMCALSNAPQPAPMRRHGPNDAAVVPTFGACVSRYGSRRTAPRPWRAGDTPWGTRRDHPGGPGDRARDQSTQRWRAAPAWTGRRDRGRLGGGARVSVGQLVLRPSAVRSERGYRTLDHPLRGRRGSRDRGAYLVWQANPRGSGLVARFEWPGNDMVAQVTGTSAAYLRDLVE